MAKNKRQKVKHYNRSFYSRETRVKRGIGIVVLVAAVLAAAWFAAPHVLDWATHTWYTVVKDRDLEAESASRAEAAASSAAASSAAASQAASELEPEEEKPLDGKAITGGSWAELDVTALTDESAIRAAARQLKQQGADYALVTLKDAAGTVYYASGVAAAAQSITENPVDAANIAAILREEGIIPAAQLAAFTDPVSVYTDRSMGVHYDGNRLWLDNVSAAKGGKAWMNPFAASAVQFVGDLIEEVRSMGYEQVVLTGVQFPNIITRKQDFGASGGKSREGRAAQLTADIAAWQTRFAGSVTLWVSYPDALCTAATDALGTTGTSLGMENLLVTSSTALDADSRAALEQAAADAGAGRHVDHVPASPSRTVAMLGQRGDIAVVIQNHRHVQPFLQIITHRKIADVDHGGGHAHIALVKQNKRRHTNTDALQAVNTDVVFLEQPVQALDHKVAKGRSICRDGRCVLKTIHQRMICVK